MQKKFIFLDIDGTLMDFQGRIPESARKALELAKKNHALNSVDVYVSGIGLGRDAAVRAISAAGIKIDSITDVTPIAHGGVRPKGERKP